ncbi:MAG TPA: flagellar export chaperone FliS [Terriglobales bacterium]|jgi:flagellar protein FliS|nr:flagellar export chaperone FliS [Terriglobales bacterium]
MTDARNSYRESVVRGATPVRLVILLYEQIIADLRDAAKAVEVNDAEKRTNRINHAILVIGHLENKLNHQAGRDVARNLERFYDMSRRKLLEAQFERSKETIDEQISFYLELREAWVQVERDETGHSAALPNSIGEMAEHRNVVDWKG